MGKRLYFGSNLKMYKTISQTLDYLKELTERTKDISRDEITLFIIPFLGSLLVIFLWFLSSHYCTKANFNILAEEEKVKKAQLELGKVYYKNFISGEDTDLAECLPLCEKITESLKLIESLKAEIEQARGGAAPEAPVQDDFNIEEVPAEEAPAEEPVIPEIVVVEDETPEAPEESAE